MGISFQYENIIAYWRLSLFLLRLNTRKPADVFYDCLQSQMDAFQLIFY